MSRMTLIQKIGFLPLAEGEIGSASGPAGIIATGTGFARAVTGTGGVGRGWGGEATELDAGAVLIDWVATAAAGAAADCTAARRGAGLLGWPQDLQNFASDSRGTSQFVQIWPAVASTATRVPHFAQNFVVEGISEPQPEQTIFFGVVRGEPQLRQNLPDPASALQCGQFMTLPCLTSARGCGGDVAAFNLAHVDGDIDDYHR